MLGTKNNNVKSLCWTAYYLGRYGQFVWHFRDLQNLCGQQNLQFIAHVKMPTELIRKY
jgi:hypothetical protein